MTDKSKKVALLIDWDNLQICHSRDAPGTEIDLAAILALAQSYGTVVTARAYAEWNLPMERLSVYKAGIEPVFAPVMRADASGERGKSLADTVIVADGVDILWTTAPDVFVLVTSDKDMIPLARLVRQRGASVVILGSDLTAIQLVELSTVFISYRQLLRELDRTGALEAPSGHAPVRERRVVRERSRPTAESQGARSSTPSPRSRSRAEPAPTPAPTSTPLPTEEVASDATDEEAAASTDGLPGRRRRRRGGRGRGRSQTMGAGVDDQPELAEPDAIEQLVAGYFESREAAPEVPTESDEVAVEAPPPPARRRGRRVVGAREPDAVAAAPSEPDAVADAPSEPEVVEHPPVQDAPSRRRTAPLGPPVFRAFGEEPALPQPAVVPGPEPGPEPEAELERELVADPPPARRSRRKPAAVAELVVAGPPEEPSTNGASADPPKRRRSSRAKPVEAGAAS